MASARAHERTRQSMRDDSSDADVNADAIKPAVRTNAPTAVAASTAGAAMTAAVSPAGSPVRVSGVGVGSADTGPPDARSDRDLATPTGNFAVALSATARVAAAGVAVATRGFAHGTVRVAGKRQNFCAPLWRVNDELCVRLPPDATAVYGNRWNCEAFHPQSDAHGATPCNAHACAHFYAPHSTASIASSAGAAQPRASGFGAAAAAAAAAHQIDPPIRHLSPRTPTASADTDTRDDAPAPSPKALARVRRRADSTPATVAAAATAPSELPTAVVAEPPGPARAATAASAGAKPRVSAADRKAPYFHAVFALNGRGDGVESTSGTVCCTNVDLRSGRTNVRVTVPAHVRRAANVVSGRRTIALTDECVVWFEAQPNDHDTSACRYRAAAGHTSATPTPSQTRDTD